MSPRVGIITGAAQGIGRGIALRLAMDGLDLALNDLSTNAVRLEEVVTIIRSQGQKAVEVTGDAASEKDVDKLIQVAVEQFGGLDVFVANAGIGIRVPVVETTLQQWDKIMNVNARGVFIGYKAAAKQMIKQGRGGRIIGTCSVAGKMGIPGLAIYAGSIFCVRALTQSAAMEWGSYGITVNAYAPGLIDTPMSAQFRDSTEKGGVFLDKIRENSAVKLVGQPEDIAGLVSYLVSDESRFITGQAININGGVVYD